MEVLVLLKLAVLSSAVNATDETQGLLEDLDIC